MTLLTREHIQSTPTFDKIEVDVTEWGTLNPETGERQRTTVFVREMSARERGQFEHAAVRRGKKVKYDEGYDADIAESARARLAVATCCDADGNLIFTPDDIKWLLAQPVKVLERIAKASAKLNGFGKEDLEEEEELVKN